MRNLINIEGHQIWRVGSLAKPKSAVFLLKSDNPEMKMEVLKVRPEKVQGACVGLYQEEIFVRMFSNSPEKPQGS